ncbi:uncharacterized protein LOC111642942 [Copidosoma floridanum]|uniref:uncharacterized protein LOC111642942 n=1 Tax=Copidosoma floridanum TaxID=29053 RepID=UPI000C6F71F9|nr:uncharacterized protein LOC111642942 [Copidosoma floridanum]
MARVSGMVIVVSLAVLFCANVADAFSKYGRGCKDISCFPNEECVMANNPCIPGVIGKCGLYPTCQKKSQPEKPEAVPEIPPEHHNLLKNSAKTHHGIDLEAIDDFELELDNFNQKQTASQKME